MNLSDIITKCYILALFIRDDGERLLLGDGFFEFKESLQHFQPNTFVNDVVELQGTDGQLLAGQVRRTAVQTFEGFIADGTIGREQTETNRRRFLQFFRKKHFYTVVYILPDGSAVQRDRGYIVNAPSAPELYQRFPEYSVGLNFEDPNYYEYDEDSDGDEIPAHSVVLSIANLLEGGLIWDAFGAVSNEKTWLDWENGITVDGLYTFNNGLAGAPLEFTQLDGNATQKTIAGKNLLNVNARGLTLPYTLTSRGITFKVDADGSVTINGKNDGTGNSLFAMYNNTIPLALQGGTYTGDTNPTDGVYRNATILIYDGAHYRSFKQNSHLSVDAGDSNAYIQVANGETTQFSNYKIYPMLEAGSTKSPYEPYVGSTDGNITPSPNPSYPQPINTVTGEQTVKITGKNLLNLLTATDAGSGGNIAIDSLGSNSITIHTMAGAGQYASRTLTSYLNDLGLKPGDIITMSMKSTGTYSGYNGRDIRIYYNSTSTTRLAKLTSEITSETFTIPNDATRLLFLFYVADGASVNTNDTATFYDIQIERGSVATPTFEPYQAQSQEINLGKNLFDKDNANTMASYISGSSGHAITAGTNNTTIYVPCEASTTYTVSRTAGNVFRVATTSTTPTNGMNTNDYIANDTGTSITITTGDSAKYLVVFVKNESSTQTESEILSALQIERGSVATSFSPYFTPYGLAKIGTYQDYIYKSGDKCYLHEEIGKTSVSLVGIYDVAGGLKGSACSVGNKTQTMSGSFCNKATIHTTGAFWDGCYHENPANFLFVGSSTDDLDALKAKYNGAKLYYVLATPTDTAITEPELLAQLNAIASTFDGVNNITITPSAGAQGELSIHYATGSIDVGAGYEWEEGSDTGTNVIVNNGIDSVFPTWIVPGPATNPTLTNITTGQTIVWEGSVASGQTLTVDLNRQTAELGGTNVFAQLSGDWVKLAPGPNKLAYSATGATEGCRLEWNGVVG